MIIRSTYDVKPQDPRFTICHHVNWLNSYADLIWMTQDEWDKKPIVVKENSEAVPKAIKDFIPKWREEARKVERDEKQFFCPIKHAQSDVYYKGNKYVIDTGMLYDIGNYMTVDWLFESIEGIIERDMYSIGAIYVEYRGMID